MTLVGSHRLDGLALIFLFRFDGPRHDLESGEKTYEGKQGRSPLVLAIQTPSGDSLVSLAECVDGFI